MRVLTTTVATALGGFLLLVPPLPSAHALSKAQRGCQIAIAKSSGKFLKAVLKEKSKCADKNLRATGSCDFAKRSEKLDKAETKLRADLQKSCVDKFPATLDAESLGALGFPGKCVDTDASNGFTGEDLKDCIFDTHAAIANAIFDLEYGSNGDATVLDFASRDPVNGKDLRKCQSAIGKHGQKFLLTVQKEISKCRNSLIKGKLTGFPAVDCGDNPVEIKLKAKLDKAASKTKDKIRSKCTTALIANPAMDACDDDGFGPQLTVMDVADCIVRTHRNATDDPDNSGSATPFPIDLIDIEYALGAVCGDNIVNDPAVPSVFSASFYLGAPPEECDGTDDVACPGACGTPGSAFPCLCTDNPRLRVDENANGDLDRGSDGTSHDQSLLGGVYTLDLYDCDGPGGPDTTCTLGPSCALAPNSPCIADSDCSGGGNFCRKTTLAVGPHCQLDPQQPCDDNTDCLGGGDFCRKQPHGVPVPLSAGGVSLCVVNVFSEDVTGTIDFATGETTYRLREAAVTSLATGTLNQPCPVCGGFCSGTSAGAGPGSRTLCAADSDCPASATCVLNSVCSYGPDEDQACRPDPPFGVSTALFGTPSLDCRVPGGSNVSGDGLDLLYDPTTTGTVTTLPSYSCTAPGSSGDKCIFGTEIGKACLVDTDCAGGGAASCAPQCFCPAGSSPNSCLAACHGGSNDYGACAADSECPGGLCEQSSCRVATGVCTNGATVGTPCTADSDCGVAGTCGDDDSSGEGFCPAGPVAGHCSFTLFQDCAVDSDCRPSGGCSVCKSDESETCVVQNLNCFPSAGYTRTGTPGFPVRVDVAHFCIPSSGSAAVDDAAGIPGPGAFQVPVTTMATP